MQKNQQKKELEILYMNHHLIRKSNSLKLLIKNLNKDYNYQNKKKEINQSLKFKLQLFYQIFISNNFVVFINKKNKRNKVFSYSLIFFKEWGLYKIWSMIDNLFVKYIINLNLLIFFQRLFLSKFVQMEKLILKNPIK